MAMNWEKMEKIGEGNQKEVYIDASDPEKVVSRFREGYSERESELTMKGRYYLSKILHLLIPNSIPDTNLTAKGEDTIIVSERKKLDSEHLEHNRIMTALREGMSMKKNDNLLEREREMREDRIERLVKDERFIAFENNMKALGVRFDEYPTNFTDDKNNNLVYIDNSFKPWNNLGLSHGGAGLRRNYYAPAIRAAIKNLDISGQSHALNYLQRLEELYLLWKKECYEKNSK